MGRRQTSSNMARDDICRSEGSLMTPERLGHPSGKTQFERAIAGSCQLARWDDASCTSQQVGTQHRASWRQASIKSSATASRCDRYSASNAVASSSRCTRRTRYASPREDTPGNKPARRSKSSSSSMPAAERPGPGSPVRSSRQCYGRTHGRRARSLPPHTGDSRRHPGARVPHPCRAA